MINNKKKSNKKKNENNFNFLLKLLSVILAIIAWYVVVQAENPDDTFTLKDIVLEAKNEEVLAQDDLIFNGFSEDEITVKFSGGKVNLGKLREFKEDILATVDINDYYTSNKYVTEEGVYLPVTVNIPDKLKSSIKIDRQSLEYVLINIDKKVTESKDVSVILKANVGNDYYVDESKIKVLPQKVEISGGKDAMDRIEKVVADVEVNSPNGEINEVAVKVYDTNGKVVEGLSVSPEKVQVQVPVLIKKTVKFNLDVKKVPKNLELDSVKFSPSEIVVAGTDDIIDKLADSLSISMDLEKTAGNYTQNKEVVLNEALVNVDNVNKVSITYTLKNSSAK